MTLRTIRAGKDNFYVLYGGYCQAKYRKTCYQKCLLYSYVQYTIKASREKGGGGGKSNNLENYDETNRVLINALCVSFFSSFPLFICQLLPFFLLLVASLSWITVYCSCLSYDIYRILNVKTASTSRCFGNF